MKLTAKQAKAVERLKGLDPANEFFWDDNMIVPKFVKGKLSKASTKDPQTIARQFLDQNKDLLDMQDGLNEKLELSHVETDKEGFRHVYFHQIVNGLPVFEGSTQVHINPQGEVLAYKDYRIARIDDISLKPQVKEKAAVETALSDLGTKTSKKEAKAHLCLYRDQSKQLHLAWEVELFVPGELGARYYFIDAHTGQLLYKFAQIRGALSRLTYTANKREVLPGRLVLRDEQTTSDAVAQAAHDHAEEVYEYYRSTFGRDSYDDQGATLVSTVHFGKDYNNAFWSDWYKQMVYGDGDGVRWKPLALALDIVGHELTHAVTSRTARFLYAEQAGALDESFADIFGVMITNDDPVTDWEMGEGVFTPFRSGDALRDLSNPAKYDQPDHMDDYLALEPGELPDSDKNDNGYVHYNSGIPNKVAFLIVEGGTHHGITVDGIGRNKAEQIYYLALTVYLSSATQSRWTFKQARYALLNACRQLYGDNGPEYAAIKNGWAAVGIGEPAENFTIVEEKVSPSAPIPDFDPAGIQSVIRVPAQGVLKDISVSVEIAHTYIGDLRVTLISPSGESVVLHDRKDGARDNIVKTFDLSTNPDLRAFIGDQIKGNWLLDVADHARVDTGKLLSWGMTLSTQLARKKTLKMDASANQQIPDKEPAGIESLINLGRSGKIINLDVSVDINHTWIGDLMVTLVSPSGQEVLLHNRTGSSRNDIKKVYTSKSDEGLRVLVGQEMKGDWRLKVADFAKEDVGILNSWSLEILYE